MAELTAAVAKAPAVEHANPQAAALSNLLDVSMDAATRLIPVAHPARTPQPGMNVR